MRLFETVVDLTEGADSLRRRRYGMIEVVDGQFRRILLQPVPKTVSSLGVLLGQFHHWCRDENRIRLYYCQPWRFPSYLTLKYAVSGRRTTLGSLSRALAVLDEIARIKHSDALLCDVSNWRISRGQAARWGWTPHCPSRWHRHYIKRFYGEYPTPPQWLAGRGELDDEAPVRPSLTVCRDGNGLDNR